MDLARIADAEPQQLIVVPDVARHTEVILRCYCNRQGERHDPEMSRRTATGPQDGAGRWRTYGSKMIYLSATA